MTKSHLLLVLTLSLGSVIPGVAQDGPPVDADVLLQTVETLSVKQSASSKAHFDKTLRDFQQAAGSTSSAMDLYEKAVYNTQFIGLNREQTQFQEWKKKEAEKLKSPEMQQAAKFHLQYLVITLQQANGTPLKEITPLLIKYTNEVVAAPEEVRKQDLMKRSISDSTIARWYGISKYVAKSKDWEPNPGNIDGIYAKVILPQWRAEKDPRILAYWDMKLQMEGLAASKLPAKFEQDQFNFVKRPSLLWSRAKDRLEIGQRNTAIKEMLEIVKTFPDHPDNGVWLGELKETLQAAHSSGTPAPAPSEAGAAG